MEEKTFEVTLTKRQMEYIFDGLESIMDPDNEEDYSEISSLQYDIHTHLNDI